jgi:hypothetical protein
LNDIKRVFQDAHLDSSRPSPSPLSLSSSSSESIDKTPQQHARLSMSTAGIHHVQQATPSHSKQHSRESLMQLGLSEKTKDRERSSSIYPKNKFELDTSSHSYESPSSESIQRGDTTSLKKPRTGENSTSQKENYTSEATQNTQCSYKI